MVKGDGETTIELFDGDGVPFKAGEVYMGSVVVSGAWMALARTNGALFFGTFHGILLFMQALVYLNGEGAVGDGERSLGLDMPGATGGVD